MTIAALIIGIVALAVSVVALIVAIDRYRKLKAKLYSMELDQTLSGAIKTLEDLPERIYRERLNRMEDDNEQMDSC